MSQAEMAHFGFKLLRHKNKYGNLMIVNLCIVNLAMH